MFVCVFLYHRHEINKPTNEQTNKSKTYYYINKQTFSNPFPGERGIRAVTTGEPGPGQAWQKWQRVGVSVLSNLLNKSAHYNIVYFRSAHKTRILQKSLGSANNSNEASGGATVESKESKVRSTPLSVPQWAV